MNSASARSPFRAPVTSRVTALLQHRRVADVAFGIMLLANMLPVLTVSYYFTGDGPAHLYNATLIRELLSSDNAVIEAFFELRHTVLPNVAGHGLLAVLLGWLSPAAAEKVLYLTIIATTALGFRYAARAGGSIANWATLLVFPLLHHFCFYIGFQGFSLGIGTMLWGVGLYLRYDGAPRKGFPWLLSLVALFTCLCHLVPAAILLLVIGLGEVAFMVRFRKWRGWIYLAMLPAVSVVLLFLGQHGSDSQVWQWPDAELKWKELQSFQALISYQLDAQRMPVLAYTWLLLLGGVMALLSAKKGVHLLLLVSSLILLALFFTIPDRAATGGFIGVRLALGAYLFWALWLAMGSTFAGRRAWILLLVVMSNGAQLRFNAATMRGLSHDAAQIIAAAQYVPASAVVVPLNYSDSWLYYNIGLYPSAFKPMVNLDNYEAYEPHFPVKWREGMAPGDRLGGFGSTRNPSFALEPYERETGKQVEVVLRYAYDRFAGNNSTTAATNALLDSLFVLHASGDGFDVWYRRGWNPQN